MMKKISYAEFNELLSKEDVCFINSFEDAVVRTEMVDKEVVYYVKFKAEEEFKAESGSSIVAGGWEEYTIIAKEEYDLY